MYQQQLYWLINSLRPLYSQVKTKILPVPRVNVDQLLALEAPPNHPSAVVESPIPKPDTPTSLEHYKPLPRIPTSSSPKPESSGSENAGKTREKHREEKGKETFDGEAFFMTQVLGSTCNTVYTWTCCQGYLTSYTCIHVLSPPAYKDHILADPQLYFWCWWTCTLRPLAYKVQHTIGL